jgi:tetratricopeptide (TPR) repeat protein
MSIIHLQMGNIESALEWAMMAFEGREILSDHSTKEPDDYLHMASALAATGRLEEAETQFHRGKELILKTRHDYAFVDYVEGLIEQANDNAADAYRCISSALDLYERVGQQNRVNYCLVRLAELEVTQFPFDIAFQRTEEATPMLRRLEILSRDRSFPGFLGIALTLLGEIELKRGDVGQARRYLNEAIEISRKPETRYLKERIAALRNLISLEHP